jgi:6-pyruvoyltetrahydropterin/6-carboxytetrahydropterin synthase
METFKEFTFDAAHSSPPFEGLHGHSFTVRVTLVGQPDPVYGWSHNLYDVNAAFDDVRRQVDHKYLNDIDGLAVPTLENVARWLWQQLDSRLSGVDRVAVTRGSPGQMEGCVFAGRSNHTS